ncbi:MAG TPA: helix-turn-helix transcriptional regulator [Allosphingosinicella sp.]|jgi:transcriptional regulator with XRE-family HTH domain|nr:helix-turn-helix transcriptional regulator [Allosphingosinicella sp.]
MAATGEEHERLARRLREVLIEARKAADIKQVDLAKALGRSQSFVSNYERGERRVDVPEFILIARELGVEMRELLGRVC